MKRPACFLGTHSMSHVQEFSRTMQNDSSFLLQCLRKTFLEAQQEHSFQGGMKAGFFASGYHIWGRPEHDRVSKMLPAHCQPAGCGCYHSCHTQKNCLSAGWLFSSFSWWPQSEGRWPWDSYQSSSCNRNSWQGDGEWGNVGLDLLPVIVLIHSWLLLTQFLAIFHTADIAFLLLPSKRIWKKCLL